MYPDFYLIQDILNKKIVAHGTKRGGLYYLNDFSLGRANKMSSKDEYGYGITSWDIPHSVIYDIYFQIYLSIYRIKI